MKNLIVIIALILGFSGFVKAQKVKPITTSIFVAGNCEHCKERLETSLDIKGVIHSEWEAKTQKLSITYKPNLVSRALIFETIQKAGHDTDSLKASDSVYANLPECCKYRKPIKP